MTTIFSGKCLRKHTFYFILIPFRPFSSLKPLPPKRNKRPHNGLRVLDLVTPKTTKRTHGARQSHLRLIEEFLEAESLQLSAQQVRTDAAYSDAKDDAVSMPCRLNKEGLRADPSALSQALSVFASERNVTVGIQAHCVAVKTGFFTNVYVGSSLISLYSKCGELGNAYKVFEEMPLRNVVSWTAMITGFAQECQVDMCLGLYRWMKNSTAKPNDFTLTSLLSACTGSGSIGQGRVAHSQAIQMGFDSFVHVSNALISMYCKCGDVEESLYIFQNMRGKDLVSWNSMIAGYAQHGLAQQAINLFEELWKQGLKPDGITFLGVLSSCRHAGFVEQGRFYFNSMAEIGLEPEIDHYSCMVDLLGRSGNIEESRDFIEKMPVDPTAVIWGSLLSSCRLHGNVWIGIEAAENRLVLEPRCAATHLQLVNLYAGVGLWDQAARLRKLMKDKMLKTYPGYSCIEIRNEVHRFRAEDGSSLRTDKITFVVDCLVDHMRNLEYKPEMNQKCGFEVLTELL